MSDINGKVAVVTGASRGAGKGIALALADAGAMVYVTGRTPRGGSSEDGLSGSIHATVDEIAERGGRAVAVPVDHRDDRQVADLFATVEREHGGLDILVNNAIALPAMPDSPTQGFWERSLDSELALLDVGLRSHYVAAHFAAPLLIKNRGLLVQISSPGARTYLPGVHGPTYGAGKAGGDKMTYDMAQELRPHGVTVMSLWPGILATERVLANVEADPDLVGKVFPSLETPEFTGRVIAALAADDEVIARTGQICYGSELGLEYGVVDVDGTSPASYRGWLGAPSSFTEVAPTYGIYMASQRG
ncbi:SDR family NAD(P)-dependent oxidoreductase [Gordonia neofelifaecis]|uniref:Putative short chain dehydrogenase n=1 Tax=Gordonia neofelifaecis NRRL B-59395 TaxID=644548 RepID=F1YG09_9ACTN|nr:SDR family NAD(P)-dependent oxidoreductase [Gordonia neofelifaecis]EGD56586.1 putative short chain dehydrogenase [Gordonia neofelifaecis NRRL B-59395]